MRYHHLRNATALLTIGGRTLLIDPWLSDRGAGPSFGGTDQRSPIVDLPLLIASIIDQANGVLLTHVHEDHFDARAKADLPRSMPILCTVPLVGELSLLGFTSIVAVDPGSDWEGITITPVMAQHGPPHVLYRMGHVVGYVLSAKNEPTVYLAADTILTDTVRAVISSHRPDVIIVNAGGAFSRGKDGPIIMDAAQVAETLALAPSATVIAVHLEATDHGRVTRSSLRDYIEAADASASRRLLIPADGEAVSLRRTS
ncbi:MBL fold metallo-hydrolase [Methylobacterium oryzisoli]|uniref:MBL fold metallo-hydrolase n=1 Tax=Methylobacterium oryzisoli TaxID=3385502 RepID=UPI003891AE08